jgi:predicted MFS family arabinose efflux permease
MISATIFAISNFLLPLSPDLHYVLVFQLISGLASGTFIPLTIGFVVQNLPTQLVIYGVAAYSLNLELSLNIAASIEGWFDDYWSWKWIFWDTALLTPLMLICIHFGMARQVALVESGIKQAEADTGIEYSCPIRVLQELAVDGLAQFRIDQCIVARRDSAARSLRCT